MNDEPIFVGRGDELAVFDSILERKVKHWVLALTGPGGMGKTKLLEQMIERADKCGVIHSGLIDFHYTDLETEAGLLSAIGSHLGTEHFPGLFQSLEACRIGPTPVREEMLNVAVEHFLSGLHRLATKHLVIFFFDMFEKATETGVAGWFLEKVLPQMRGNTIVVLVGRNAFLLADEHEVAREPGYTPAIIPLPAEEVYLLRLAPFSLPEVQEYLEKCLARRGEENVPLRVDPHRYADLVKPAGEVPTIWEKSEGHPLIVALAADWLAEWGIGTITVLADLSPEQFKREMVVRVRDLETPEDETILRMAHIYHRFNAEILDATYPELKERGFDSRQAIQNLRRFSFVKYWSETGDCLLHDELQRLVEQYVWGEIDAAQDARRAISAEAVKCYGRILARETDERKRWSLEAELMYHWLYSNLEEARPKFWRQMAEAWSTYRLDLMRMLLSKGDEANRRLCDPVLGVLCQAAHAWVSLGEWNLEDARQWAQAALDNPACTRRIRATVLAALGVHAERRGDEDRAIGCYEQALDLCRNLERRLELEGEKLPDEYNIPDLHGVRADIAFLLNSIGIVHRRKGLMDKAVVYFEHARSVACRQSDLEWWTASLNNAGNVERLRGNLPQAFQWCKQALRLRERLKLKEEYSGSAYLRDLALSHNTFGMVLRDMQEHDEAGKHFEQARQIFEQIHDKLGLAGAIRNIGWVCYLRGKTAQDPAARRKHFEEALRYYGDSRQICEASQIGSELPNLWNKIGIAERALGNTQAAQQAFARSLEEARKRNDNLFIANDLVRLAEMAYGAHDLEQVTEYAAELRRDFQEQGFSFGLAYAEMEELLAQVAFDAGEYEEAFHRLGENYAHLARLNRRRFDRKFHLLEEFFDGLPDDDWRRRCAEQLIRFWKEQGLEKDYADLTTTCEEYIMEV